MAEINKFVCILCNESYESKEQLNVHFRLHADQSLKNKTNASVQNNEKDTTIPCDVCMQEFKTISLAIQHKYKKHPDAIMKYFCKFCGMQFPLKTTHDKHLSTHNNEKPRGEFPCLDCNAMFVSENGRSYHIKSAHNRVTSLIKPVNTPPPSKKIRLNNANEAQSVYYCYLCGVPYINKFNLQRHLEKNHSEIERNNIPADMLKCTTCDALFYTKQAYDCHVFDHKPDDLYVTSEEQRLQTVTRVDQDFDIRRVQLPTEKFIPTTNKPNRKPCLQTKTNLPRQHKKDETDEELSPTSDVESSSDEDESPNATIPTKNSHSAIKSKNENLKNVVVKKRLYAIVDANGLITQTCTNIPKNAVLAKSNLIKLKNSDILKTLNKSNSSKINVKVTNTSEQKTIHLKQNDNQSDNRVVLSKTNKMNTDTMNYDSSNKSIEDDPLPIYNLDKVADTKHKKLSKNSSAVDYDLLNYDSSSKGIEEDSLRIFNLNKVTDADTTNKKLPNNLSTVDIQNFKTNQLKIIKIVLNRLPEKYEKILINMKNETLSSEN